MTSYATPADMIVRHDVRTLGDLVTDTGVRVTAGALATDANLQAALDDASGEIEAAIFQAKRYTAAELASLTGNSQKYLKRLCCTIAFGLLWERRPWGHATDDQREDASDRARKALERLRRGEHVFDLEPQETAGLPATVTPSISSITRQNLVVDACRRGVYPARRLPFSGGG